MPPKAINTNVTMHHDDALDRAEKKALNPSDSMAGTQCNAPNCDRPRWEGLKYWKTSSQYCRKHINKLILEGHATRPIPTGSNGDAHKLQWRSARAWMGIYKPFLQSSIEGLEAIHASGFRYVSTEDVPDACYNSHGVASGNTSLSSETQCSSSCTSTFLDKNTDRNSYSSSENVGLTQGSSTGHDVQTTDSAGLSANEFIQKNEGTDVPTTEEQHQVKRSIVPQTKEQWKRLKQTKNVDHILRVLLVDYIENKGAEKLLLNIFTTLGLLQVVRREERYHWNNRREFIFIYRQVFKGCLSYGGDKRLGIAPVRLNSKLIHSIGEKLRSMLAELDEHVAWLMGRAELKSYDKPLEPFLVFNNRYCSIKLKAYREGKGKLGVGDVPRLHGISEIKRLAASAKASADSRRRKVESMRSRLQEAVNPMT